MKIIVIGGSGLIGSTLVTGGMRPWRRDPASGVDTVTGQGLAAESAAEVGHHPPRASASPGPASMTGLNQSTIGNS